MTVQQPTVPGKQSIGLLIIFQNNGMKTEFNRGRT
jgi:hypothetical protein